MSHFMIGMVAILGINPGINNLPWSIQLGRHDPSACIIKNGEILAAVEEERFSRNKWGQQKTATLPENSIRFVLDHTNISDVDIVAIGWDPSNAYKRRLATTSLGSLVPSSLRDAKQTHRYIEKNYSFAKDLVAGYKLAENRAREVINNQLDNILRDGFNGEIVFVSHHRSHAASAYYCSNFENQITIAADGGGEHRNTVVFSEDMNVIKEFTRPNSIGHFYSKGAEYLGYTKPSGSRHAGKVMGLASYGEYRKDFADVFDKLVKVEDRGYDVTKFRAKGLDELEEFFGEKHEFPNDFKEHHKDFAFHLQNKTEEIMKNLVKSFVNKRDVNNISLAGGVFLNCKMNLEIAKLDCINDVFIQPASNDAGVALGAALEVSNSVIGKKPVSNFDNVYLGTEYGNSEIEQILDDLKLSYQKIESPTKRAAELLSNNKLIGWFQGRMEFGPRALGNRSILANPKSTKARDLVNKNVKNRAEWRPFAPSLLHESKDDYLENGFESPYMIMTDEICENKQEEVPGIVHVDGTARPQTVREEQNKKYYNLLKEFEERTETPVLLNTSFNVSGEPIVESPKQAIADFYSTGLDALFINDYLIEK